MHQLGHAFEATLGTLVLLALIEVDQAHQMFMHEDLFEAPPPAAPADATVCSPKQVVIGWLSAGNAVS
jgi:hypothetical protein